MGGHWFRGGSDPQDPNSLAIDLWPDTSELDADERCPTAFHLPSGAPAFLFSDQNPKTVARHFASMKQYGIDGAAMRRFLTNIASADLRQGFRYRSRQRSRGAARPTTVAFRYVRHCTERRQYRLFVCNDQTALSTDRQRSPFLEAD
jgi:hypothetical protein